MSRPVALVTGGARGLGRATALHLAGRDWDLALLDGSEAACRVYGEADSIEEVLGEIRAAGARAWFSAVDLTDEPAALAAVDAAERALGPIAALVTFAGGDIRGRDAEASGGKAKPNSAFASHGDFTSVFDRNFWTTVHACRAAGAKMRDRGRGRIVTVSSVAAGFGVEKETAYATAKAAVLHFTRSLAAELRPHGVCVNCVVPGPTNTARFRATLAHRSPTDREAFDARGTLDRIAEPEDVARVVAFFLGEDGAYVSGQVLRVDGGRFTSPI